MSNHEMERSSHRHGHQAAPSRPGAKPAQQVTIDYNNSIHPPKPGEDPELANASANRVLALPNDFTVFKGPMPIWTLATYNEFLTADESKTAPDEVNPSLWRNASLNMNVGVYEVVKDAVYQVRGVDLSNITFLEKAGSHEVIAVDPLVSQECAAEALKLYRQARAAKGVKDLKIAAVIYTHSHVDHYGGVRGLFENGTPGPTVKFYAPDGFLDHVVSENVYAGVAMARRATFMYGPEVPKAPNGQVDSGLGKTTSVGTVGFINAPETITATDTKMYIAGIEVIFQLTPDTEAPSEMNFYLPEIDALCLAENATPTLHNIYSLRGAQVRDAKAWSEYLNQTIETWGSTATTLFASHFWPRWGNSTIVEFLTNQADMYRFIHDQTLHWANQGDTIIEVAERLDGKLPPTLANEWYNHGYYGTMNHNVKAVYQRYLGWFDGNPANLHPLTPQKVGPRYVEAIGGAGRLLEIANETYKNAQSLEDYRWLVELLNHLVFADPSDPVTRKAAHDLQADVLEQLGYMAESGPWRNFYLAAADELRIPAPKPQFSSAVHADVVAAMPVKSIWDYIGIRLIADNVTGKSASMSFTISHGLPNDDPFCVVRLRNSVVVYSTKPASDPQATYTITRKGLNALALSAQTVAQLITDHELKVDSGTTQPLDTINDNLVKFIGNWPIAGP
ncbi:alkyl/aryl-sulfatase [Nonomuraea sp. NPDC050536]|uniref:alkyl/aryl-sulfatase n=1 Tax=Nonomuraea sp. NPDC050536 TaxID=3364366 RepID=UPI0037CA2EBD